MPITIFILNFITNLKRQSRYSFQAASISVQEASLETAKQQIQEQPQPVETSEEDLVQQILTIRDEINTAKGEDIPALTDQLTREIAILENLRNTPKKQRTNPKNPYFGHIKLVEDNFVQDVFIGQSNFLSDDLVVVHQVTDFVSQSLVTNIFIHVLES